MDVQTIPNLFHAPSSITGDVIRIKGLDYAIPCKRKMKVRRFGILIEEDVPYVMHVKDRIYCNLRPWRLRLTRKEAITVVNRRAKYIRLASDEYMTWQSAVSLAAKEYRDWKVRHML